ncbi:MAG: 4Fe-4S binding protein [Spirochaetes bacterium]|nr:4Fe-4S binding protein [Spirochaetota bacterium]
MIGKIREAAKRMLDDGTVRLFLGYGKNGLGDTVPVFLKHKEDVEALYWDETCRYNLTRYLTDRDVICLEEGPVGVIVKGCDQKSLKVLISEKQVERDEIRIVGVVCSGMKDDNEEILSKCGTCDSWNPDETFCDIVIGQTVERKIEEDEYSDVEEVEALDPAQREKLWGKYFDRCLRCYACRNVCPLCYCKECILEQNDPEWVPPSASKENNFYFHIIRAYHLTGRCTDCGECERACPVGIPLRTINRKMIKAVKDGFDFVAGKDPEARSPLTRFRRDDREDFIT